MRDAQEEQGFKDMTLTRLSFESFERNAQLLTTDDAIKCVTIQR
jgi:hypothetical protein